MNPSEIPAKTPSNRQTALELIRVVDWRETPDVSIFDWQHLLPAAEKNRLLSYLYDRLKGQEQLDPVVMQTLAAASRQSFAEVAHQLQMLPEIAYCLQDFQWVLLRGPALGTQFYSKLHNRPFVDLDVLVDEHEVEDSLARLRSMNYNSPKDALDDNYYRTTHLHVHLKRKQGPFTGAVEIHWRLDHPFMLYSIDNDAILARRQWLELAGCTIPVPEPHDLILTVAIHMVKHAVNLHTYLANGESYRLVDDGELLRILDVGLAYNKLAPQLDWELLSRRAAEWGSQAAMIDSLMAVEQLWPRTVNPAHINMFGKIRRRTWVRHLSLPLQSRREQLREDVFFRPVRLLDLVDYLVPPHEYFERNNAKATIFVRAAYFLEALPRLVKAITSLIYYSIKQRISRRMMSQSERTH